MTTEGSERRGRGRSRLFQVPGQECNGMEAAIVVFARGTIVRILERASSNIPVSVHNGMLHTVAVEDRDKVYCLRQGRERTKKGNIMGICMS